MPDAGPADPLHLVVPELGVALGTGQVPRGIVLREPMILQLGEVVGDLVVEDLEVAAAHRTPRGEGVRGLSAQQRGGELVGPALLFAGDAQETYDRAGVERRAFLVPLEVVVDFCARS